MLSRTSSDFRHNRSPNDAAAGSTLVPPSTPLVHGGAAGNGSGRRAVVGCISLRNIGKDPENQDAYVAGQNASGSKCFVGVFDGHGEKGRIISHFARDTMSKSLFDSQKLHSNPKSALEGAYQEAQRQIEKRHGANANQSGTTAVAAYQHHDRLFVANVGDSRAVLGRCDTSRGTLKPIDLSSDHKPSRADERQRILAAGGKVDQSCFPMMQGGSMRWMKAGPERVMDRSGMGGLAVSRSLGDLCLRPFVSATPEIVERKLDSKDKFMILGSDGIWDHMTSKEAVDIAGRIDDPNQASNEIASICKQRWQRETQGMLADDITAVVVRLDGRNSAPSSDSRLSTARLDKGPARPPSSYLPRQQDFAASPGKIRPRRESRSSGERMRRPASTGHLRTV
jgi:serine/threonine protein phosphatase PrpC